jgi:hypothetical protein
VSVAKAMDKDLSTDKAVDGLARQVSNFFMGATVIARVYPIDARPLKPHDPDELQCPDPQRQCRPSWM